MLCIYGTTQLKASEQARRTGSERSIIRMNSGYLAIWTPAQIAAAEGPLLIEECFLPSSPVEGPPFFRAAPFVRQYTDSFCSFCDPVLPAWLDEEQVRWAQEPEQKETTRARCILVNVALTELRYGERNTLPDNERRLNPYRTKYRNHLIWLAQRVDLFITPEKHWEYQERESGGHGS